MAREIILDGLNLQEGDFRITGAPDIFSAPPKEIKTVDLAREDGSVVVFEKYLPKDAGLQGYINTADELSADLALDTLKRYSGRKGIELKVGYAGGYRIWTVEVETVIVSRNASDLSYIPFSIKIKAANPIATDDTEDTLVNATGVTTSSKTVGVNNDGTYKAKPVIVLTVNAIDPSVSDVTISISNPSNQETISFTDTFVATDVITIDCVNNLVFLNSTSIPAVGQFPTWEPDGGTFEYSDTATTRDVDIMATYAKRYL